MSGRGAHGGVVQAPAKRDRRRTWVESRLASYRRLRRRARGLARRRAPSRPGLARAGHVLHEGLLVLVELDLQPAAVHDLDDLARAERLVLQALADAVGALRAVGQDLGLLARGRRRRRGGRLLAAAVVLRHLAAHG